jgi:myo-inositol-1(or 4)-monophosphatase
MAVKTSNKKSIHLKQNKSVEALIKDRALAIKLLNEIQASIILNLNKITELRNHREKKTDGSYVTKGDLLVEKIVENNIYRLIKNYSIISEESGEKTLGHHAEFLIVVDPIDGTENFTSGLPEWGVAICCYKSGIHLASMLGCPELKLWLLSGELVESKNTSRIRALSSSFKKEDLVRIVDGYEYRIFGCCVYNLIQVIKGSVFSFENPKGANAWDILAGINLALENGLKVNVNEGKYAGEYLKSNKKYRFQISN